MSSPEPTIASTTGAINVRRRRVIVAATIGNLLEWYDNFIYGVLALTMARLFFPAGNEATSLILAFVTYGAGLAMRPVGAIVLGFYADRIGRSAALYAAMFIMGLGTALMAFAPTYQTIGVWAPLIVLLARLLQGFSGAGEIGSATALLVESAPAGSRGLYASLNASSQQIGFVLAAFVVMVMNLAMTQDEIDAGGWRLPFVFGLAIVPAALYIRANLGEPDIFRQRAKERRMRSAFAIGRAGPLLLALGMLFLYVIAGSVLFVYMPTFAVQKLGLTGASALFATVVATCVTIACTPAAGAMSDRLGRKPLLWIATVSFVLLTYPAFVLILAWPSIALLLLVQSGFGMLLALYVGPLFSALAELFPTRIRAVAVSLTYGIAGIIGAFAPALATWLIVVTGLVGAPAFAVIGAATLSAFALLAFEDRSGEPLS
ncbi:MFS transporter [Bradyrhizobium liaoningense]|uniref:MFS transporter n=1 Tax=Bradyrhizobium liaoningense TaxID=43992 RepID=UPI001BAC6381|nr:MFS transporter [Bradyrhizobium liaoningense]MBR0906381.1 MFS transporter [Bradyrhizobium liaoningense]